MADRLIINCPAYLKGVDAIFYGVNFPLVFRHVNTDRIRQREFEVKRAVRRYGGVNRQHGHYARAIFFIITLSAKRSSEIIKVAASTYIMSV